MKLYHHIRKCLLAAGMLVSTAAPVWSANTTITATLDSAYILMGKQTTLHLEIVGDNDAGHLQLDNNADTIVKEVEIINLLPADTADLGNNRRQIKQDMIIQSFDSGLYTLPPFVYVSGKDTFRSNTLVLKVLPVPVDTLQSVHGYADVVDAKSHFFDFLPDFVTDNWGWILLGILLVAGAVAAYFVATKRVTIQLVPPKKPIPPYQLAIENLNRLRDEKLCEKGQEKEFYTRLTDILRIYLDQRFGINAMEMTSSQIISKLNDNEQTKQPNRYMRQILEIADFVKFAKVRPLPDDNVKSFNSAIRFVEETKPEEPSEENKESTNNDK